jgi:hypothetical protein
LNERNKFKPAHVEQNEELTPLSNITDNVIPAMKPNYTDYTKLKQKSEERKEIHVPGTSRNLKTPNSRGTELRT